jgi:antitoxin (DNA-binding transcriptional repressor) of toxin-antitoxin stability system
VLHFRRKMKTATVRELRNRYTQLLKWLEAGEEIRITRRGVVIARLVPENHATARGGVSWTKSAAFALDRLNLRPLTAKESAELLDYNKGPF